jgi:F0F1-type ATP synthase assembly protein I
VNNKSLLFGQELLLQQLLYFICYSLILKTRQLKWTTTLLATFALAIAGRDMHFISFLFVIQQQFRAENSLLSNRIKISTFCSFTGQTFQQKVINCPAIANAWPLAEID